MGLRRHKSRDFADFPYYLQLIHYCKKAIIDRILNLFYMYWYDIVPIFLIGLQNSKWETNWSIN